MISIITVLLYQNLDGTTAGVQNRLGALWFLTLNMGFGGINNVGLVFAAERPVFLREVNNNMYRVSSYFWSKILTELPASIIFPAIQITICYFGIGLNTNEWYKFFIALLAALLNYNAFTGFGYILGTAVNNKQLVVILTPVLVVPMMLFAGFFVNQDNVPKFLYPIREITIFKYAF
jgi:ABC-type multidrug transport system permease subunit